MSKGFRVSYSGAYAMPFTLRFIHGAKVRWSKQMLYHVSLEVQVAIFPTYTTQNINKASHDILINILQTTWFTSIEVDFEVCRMYFRIVGFQKVRVKLTLRKCILLQILWCTIHKIWSFQILKLYTQIITNFEMK